MTRTTKEKEKCKEKKYFNPYKEDIEHFDPKLCTCNKFSTNKKSKYIVII
jgi:hypothetical protein